MHKQEQSPYHHWTLCYIVVEAHQGYVQLSGFCTNVHVESSPIIEVDVACVAGYFFSMISESQFYVASPGDAIAMECNFHADGYEMFEHPVVWRKEQLNESFDMNILGTIIEPFAAVNRFEVAFNSVGPRYQLELSIRGQ